MIADKGCIFCIHGWSDIYIKVWLWFCCAFNPKKVNLYYNIILTKYYVIIKIKNYVLSDMYNLK